MSRTAEQLSEMLEEYAYEVEEYGDEREGFQDGYIVDGVLDMREELYKNDSIEGRFYEEYVLITDKPVKIYEKVEVIKFMSQTTEIVKVMAIDRVRIAEDGKMIVELLGRKVRS